MTSQTRPQTQPAAPTGDAKRNHPRALWQPDPQRDPSCWKARSKSRPAHAHTLRVHDDGALTCNCEASRAKAPSCEHRDRLRARLHPAVAPPPAPAEAPAPEAPPAEDAIPCPVDAESARADEAAARQAQTDATRRVRELATALDAARTRADARRRERTTAEATSCALWLAQLAEEDAAEETAMALRHLLREALAEEDQAARRTRDASRARQKAAAAQP